jgi:hypothetical protein
MSVIRRKRNSLEKTGYGFLFLFTGLDIICTIFLGILCAISVILIPVFLFSGSGIQHNVSLAVSSFIFGGIFFARTTYKYRRLYTNQGRIPCVALFLTIFVVEFLFSVSTSGAEAMVFSFILIAAGYWFLDSISLNLETRNSYFYDFDYSYEVSGFSYDRQRGNPYGFGSDYSQSDFSSIFDDFAPLFSGIEFTDELLKSIFIPMGKVMSICTCSDQLKQICLDELIYQISLPRLYSDEARAYVTSGVKKSNQEILSAIDLYALKKHGSGFVESVFALVVTPIFYDEVVTRREKNFFDDLAQCFGLQKIVYEGIFASLIKKYGLMYDNEAGQYVNAEDYRYRYFRNQKSSGSESTSSEDYSYSSVEVRKAYNTLQSSKDDTPETLRKNYRRLIARYHPDKAIANGLPESEIEKYNEMTKNINLAWELICKVRNIC